MVLYIVLTELCSLHSLGFLDCISLLLILVNSGKANCKKSEKVLLKDLSCKQYKIFSAVQSHPHLKLHLQKNNTRALYCSNKIPLSKDSHLVSAGCKILCDGILVKVRST